MYKEKLPQSCPPSNSTEPTNLVVYRLLKSNPVRQEDFDSHAKLGIALHVGADDCRWSSCSVFDDIAKVTEMLRLPKFKRCHIGRLTLSEASGRVLQGKKGHYDWWIYKAFDPVAASTIVT